MKIKMENKVPKNYLPTIRPELLGVKKSAIKI